MLAVVGPVLLAQIPDWKQINTLFLDVSRFTKTRKRQKDAANFVTRRQASAVLLKISSSSTFNCGKAMSN